MQPQAPPSTTVILSSVLKQWQSEKKKKIPVRTEVLCLQKEREQKNVLTYNSFNIILYHHKYLEEERKKKFA